MADYSIGLDLGGTNLRAAALDRSGKMLQKVAVSTDPSSRERMLEDIVGVIDRVKGRCGADGLIGIGVGVPGFILMKEGVILNSNNLSVLENFPFRDEIQKRLGTPFILENDANAAALGEKWMGAGREVDDLVLLTLGTGIGGGIVIGGRALHGYLGMAGELGHITVVPNGNPCGCGNRGCLEKHASASAVVSMARLLNLGGDDITSKQVYDLALAGSEPAKRVFEQMGEALGVALAMLVNTFNFPLYLLSGGALGAWDQFAPTMLETVRWRSFTYRATKTRIEKATLGDEAGLYGAGYLPWIRE
jgi:glucokinase